MLCDCGRLARSSDGLPTSPPSIPCIQHCRHVQSQAASALSVASASCCAMPTAAPTWSAMKRRGPAQRREAQATRLPESWLGSSLSRSRAMPQMRWLTMTLRCTRGGGRSSRQRQAAGMWGACACPCLAETGCMRPGSHPRQAHCPWHGTPDIPSSLPPAFCWPAGRRGCAEGPLG